VTLRALVLSVSEGAAASVREGGYGRCSFCGGQLGPELGAPTSDTGNAAAQCALCVIVRHLDRPRIDDEAELVWLPEMSQPAMNITMREIHLRLRALGESLDAATPPQRDTPERRRLYHARAALRERAGAAVARLGSGLPSELGRALLRLSPSAYARRGKLLGGLRLLPAGHFFDGERDIYPAIVDGWSDIAASALHRPRAVARAGA
jgi:intracellular multiplication protein IcmJ